MKTLEEPRKLPVNLLDLAVILLHVHQGAAREDVGFEDCERTLSELTQELVLRRVLVDKSALESALWSCNLMDEVGEFWQPSGEGFDNFIRRLLRYARPDEKLEFDRIYNYIKKSKAATAATSQQETP